MGEGNGPVNALDQALRQAVGQLYPEIERLELIDYKVRITDAAHGTDAMTRVLVETSDGASSWVTVGVGNNVVEASWEALTDGLTYGLLRSGRPRADVRAAEAKAQQRGRGLGSSAITGAGSRVVAHRRRDRPCDHPAVDLGDRCDRPSGVRRRAGSVAPRAHLQVRRR